MRLLERRAGLAAIDVTAVALAHLPAVLAFGPVFGGTQYLITGLGALAAGIVVGVVTSLRPLRGWLLTLAGIVLAFLAVGPALAVPRATIGGVLPTLDAYRELLLGVIHSWKGLLTAEPPAEGFPSLLVVPFLVLLVSSALSTVLALRLRRGAAFAMLPPALALATAIMFGTKIATWPALLGLVLAGVAVGWSAWRASAERHGRAVEVEVTRDTQHRAAARRSRWLGAAAMLGTALLVGGAASLPIQPTDRRVLRDTVEPPVELRDFPSPLAGFRGWHKNYEDADLFTVSGMPEGSRIRIAALDAYDGTVFAVAGSEQATGSGAFTRVGDEIQVQQQGDPASITIEMGAYTGVWVPTVGYAQAIDFGGAREDELQGSLSYNAQTGTAIALDGLAAGDSIRIDAIVPVAPEPEALDGASVSSVAVPEATNVPDALESWVGARGGDARTASARIQHLIGVMNQGAYSDGLGDAATSLSGHSASRLEAFVSARTLLGDDEQYATAFALALRQLGIPSRVVMGFYPDEGFPGGDEPVQITGAELHAWVEVPFEGQGWVAFDPTPPEDQTQVEPEPQPQPDPKPQVLQPPQPPDEPAELTPDTQPDEGEQEDEEPPAADWSWVLWFVVPPLVVILLLSLPFLVIGLMKARRRKQRLAAEREADRLSGGWDEMVDAAVDLGLEVPKGVTRQEVAATVGDRYSASRAQAIGAFVDAGVFGPGDPERSDVDAFWDDVDAGVGAMRSTATRGERIRSRLSLRSFRRRRGERRRR